jgi:hypothetical protein
MAKQVDSSPSLPVSLLFTPFVRSLFGESGHIVPEIPFANRVFTSTTLPAHTAVPLPARLSRRVRHACSDSELFPASVAQMPTVCHNLQHAVSSRPCRRSPGWLFPPALVATPPRTRLLSPSRWHKGFDHAPPFLLACLSLLPGRSPMHLIGLSRHGCSS